MYPFCCTTIETVVMGHLENYRVVLRQNCARVYEHLHLIMVFVRPGSAAKRLKCCRGRLTDVYDRTERTR